MEILAKLFWLKIFIILYLYFWYFIWIYQANIQSVTQITIRVSQKKRHISSDFQMRYDAFSETPIFIIVSIVLHSVEQF